MFVSVLDKQVQPLFDGDSVGAIVRIGHTAIGHSCVPLLLKKVRERPTEWNDADKENICEPMSRVDCTKRERERKRG